MNEAITAGEIILALAVICVVGGLAALFYRTRALGREGNMAVMAIRYPGGAWRTGMIRYRSNRLEWFSFRSLTTKAEHSWERGDFYLGSRKPLEQQELPRAMSGDAVSVDVECEGERFAIAMAPGDYTALRSWSESAPPGLHTDRF